jgi:phage recombination protein Bet
MTNELIKTMLPIEKVSKETILAFLAPSLVGKNLPQDKINFAVKLAEECNLNPFKREVHFIAYANDITLVTGYEVYIKRADNHPAYDGFDTTFEGTYEKKIIKKEFNKRDGGKYTKDVEVCIGNFSCTCKVYRKDRTRPTVKTVYLEEYTQDNEMWATKTRSQLEKVAIAQAHKLAFPNELGGLPYTYEEMQAEIKNDENNKKETTQDKNIITDGFTGVKTVANKITKEAEQEKPKQEIIIEPEVIAETENAKPIIPETPINPDIDKMKKELRKILRKFSLLEDKNEFNKFIDFAALSDNDMIEKYYKSQQSLEAMVELYSYINDSIKPEYLSEFAVFAGLRRLSIIPDYVNNQEMLMGNYELFKESKENKGIEND